MDKEYKYYKNRLFVPMNLVNLNQNIDNLKLGEGSFGQVLCRKMREKTKGPLDCAIKFFKQVNQKKLIEIRNEIEILKQLKHPNIVKFYCERKLKSEDQFVLIFEACKESLRELVTQFNRTSKLGVPQDSCKIIIYQILKALSYLHYLGIVHGDLKMENIMFNKQNELKLIDFGCSKQIKVYKGTMMYLPPEKMKDHCFELSQDIWALGLIIYELFGGDPKKIIKQLKKIVRGKQKDFSYEKIYISSVDELANDFLKCCIQIKSCDRKNPWQLMNHPYLEGSKGFTTSHTINTQQLQQTDTLKQKKESITQKQTDDVSHLQVKNDQMLNADFFNSIGQKTATFNQSHQSNDFLILKQAEIGYLKNKFED